MSYFTLGWVDVLCGGCVVCGVVDVSVVDIAKSKNHMSVDVMS